MPLSRSNGRSVWVWVGAAGIIAAVVAAAIGAWSRLRDRQVARDIEAEVIKRLESLPANDPVVLRYGTFVRLEGEGYERSVSALGLPTLPLAIDRKAVFTQASVNVSIVVRPGRRTSVTSLTMGETILHAQTEHPRCPAH